jgi:nicotinate-nucleotide adenylyltransferase
MKVGFYGGSFNPPHVSHVLAVSYVLATQPLDRVLVVPCFDHPLGKELAPFTHRRAMCELAFARLRDVEVSSIEQEMGETSRTLYTLRALRASHPDWSLRLIIGADILNETERWFGCGEIVRLAPPLVLGRLGHPRADVAPPVVPQVSSTDVRDRLARGLPVDDVVPRSVIDYVRANRLYGAP